MHFKQFIERVNNSITDASFIKLSFGNYIGADSFLKQIFVKPCLIKKQVHYQFTYRNKTNDVAKNYLAIEALTLIAQYAETEFGIMTLFTKTEEVIYEKLKNGKSRIRIKANIITADYATLAHDSIKHRNIANTSALYLHLLGITDKQGKVLHTSQDKYKQINHYIEILSSHISKLAETKPLHIADMGCGKGYLTFALYDYIKNNLQKNVFITGVENRPDLVAQCNTYSQQSAFTQLQFVENNIAQYDAGLVNVLIALHACDTATDDAIAKGILSQADLIVVAPCCHKQIRRAIEKSNTKNNFSYITKHGIMLERTAEMITDSMRALILEYHGYKTKVFEFITDVHTPKNIMIIAEKGTIDKSKQPAILDTLSKAKAEFGIDQHYLEQVIAH